MPARPIVLVAGSMIHPIGDQILSEAFEVRRMSAYDEDTLCREARGASAIISKHGLRVTGRVMDAAGGVRVLSSFGSGYDSIDVAAATERGIPVVNARGVGPESVAEHVIALMLDVAKKVSLADRYLRVIGMAGESSDATSRRRLQLFEGREIAGATLGVVGFGEIGRLVAKRCRGGFDMEIVYFDPFADPPPELSWAQRAPTLTDVLRRSDVVTLHVPLDESTHHLIGEPELRAMKADAILVNCSRGAVIDEQALVDTLRSGHLWGAGVDVFEHEPPGSGNPLYALANIVLTPHAAGLTRESAHALAAFVASNVAGVVHGESPKNLVNPEYARAPGSRSREGGS